MASFRFPAVSSAATARAKTAGGPRLLLARAGIHAAYKYALSGTRLRVAFFPLVFPRPRRTVKNATSARPTPPTDLYLNHNTVTIAPDMYIIILTAGVQQWEYIYIFIFLKTAKIISVKKKIKKCIYYYFTTLIIYIRFPVYWRTAENVCCCTLSGSFEFHPYTNYWNNIIKYTLIFFFFFCFVRVTYAMIISYF